MSALELGGPQQVNPDHQFIFLGSRDLRKKISTAKATLRYEKVNQKRAEERHRERDGTQVENQFKGGKLAVWMGGPWVLGSVERSDDENWVPAARKNVGIAPMPAGPGGPSAAALGGSTRGLSVLVDDTGKRSGRGAYLCRASECWQKGLRKETLARALRESLGPAGEWAQLLGAVSPSGVARST